jgi:hypothetical protein
MTAGHAFVVPLHDTSHLQEPAQLTVPHAGSRPVQFALHAPVPQLSVPHAALPPEQFAMQSPVVQLMLPHAALPAQVALQSPVVQLMLPHALSPVQLTLQSLVVQVIAAHASVTLHVMSHDADVAQLIEPHAPAVVHSILQFQPEGQLMLPLPVPTIMQVLVEKSHMPLQIAGHTAASSGRLGASICGF